MKKVYLELIFLVPALIILSLPSLHAGDGNYQNYIVGERAAGMGGAATALAQSVDACFFNPAGLADTPASTISLSASIYGFYDLKVTDGWWPQEDMDVDSFISIPSTFGSIWKVDEKITIAFSAFIPDKTSSNDLEAFVDRDHYFKYNKDDQTVWIGPSASYRLSPDLSVGMSVFCVYRTFSYFRDVFLGDYDFSFSDDTKYSNVSLLTVLGAKYALGDIWSLGLTVQTPSIHLTGAGESLTKSIYFGLTEVRYIEDAATKNKIPTKVTAGIACQVPKVYALGLDISYHLPTSFNRLKGEDQSGIEWLYPLRRKGTVDVNLGGEYYIKKRYPLRLGFFTSVSSAPKFDPDVPESKSYPPHINKYGITASVGRETENTTLNLGINYVWGSGEEMGWKRSQQTGWDVGLVDAKESYLYIFLASSYLF